VEETMLAKRKERRSSKRMDKCGLTEEELLREQELLFERARLRYLEGQVSSAQASPLNFKHNPDSDSTKKAEEEEKCFMQKVSGGETVSPLKDKVDSCME
jgi:hypothetical protein